MSVPLPLPRPGGTAPQSPGILDQILEFGKGALNLWGEVETQKTAREAASDLAMAERLQAERIAALSQGGPATPGADPSYANSLGNLPEWVWPVVIAGGVGLIAVAVMR